MEQFWKDKSLKQLTFDQWESLCDGCALCCLHKLEDEDTGEIYYTQVGCQLLDIDTCACKNYSNRTAQIPSCLQLTIDKTMMNMLPKTCAYRLLFEGKELPDWHHLVCGDKNRVHEEKISCRGKAIDEDMVDMDEIEDYVIYLLN
ncbi:MAG: YcgN family cysteine cluster protein [Bacteriovoracaceae bacterium]|nr:YcgN family cysteine cluster protein [Bacteriovoracaceae bacterium]